MLLGINLAVFNDQDIHHAMEKAASLGARSIEINAENSNTTTPSSRLLDATVAQSLRDTAREYGLTISAVGNHADAQLIGGPYNSDTDLIHPGSAPEKKQYGIEQLLQTARAAAELEVDTVIGFTGCSDWSRWFPWPNPYGWENMLPEFVETWTPILDQFQSLGIRFAHEPHPKQLVHNLETAIEVGRALGDRPEWGYNLDCANLMLAGVDPAIFIQELGPRIYHVHAKDIEFVEHNIKRSGFQSHGAWDRPNRGVRFRIPGWGDVHWKRILSELALANYRGSISIEHEDAIFSREEGIRKAIDFLKPLIIDEPREPCWW